MAGRRSTKDPQSVKLTPADAFDLIRWLARSQSDPRKAVAELVQNAIDANATSIAIERHRRGRRTLLTVRDDGEGIRPTEDREAALRYIATHIGRSHKRNLSPAERHAQIVAGQYGIGLLGFWSIGRRMEIRSRVAGSQVWMLRLVEDEPRAEVVPAPPAIDLPPTFTEIVVSEVHAAALRPLALARLAEYLGAELRGPITQSGATIELREYDARGQLADRVTVTPRRFDGVRLDVPSPIAVPHHTPIVVELYQAVGEAPAGVELTCAGIVVAERLGDLSVLGLDTAPWTDPQLAGTIEFAGFAVPPGTRRGVIPNAASEAFIAALAQLAPHVQRALDRQLEQRHAASERQLLGELRRALRGLRDRLPHLELPAGLTGRGGAGRDSPDPLGLVAPSPTTEPTPGPAKPGDAPNDAADDGPDEALPPTLLPPGPANHVALTPDPIRLWPGGARRVRATVTDIHAQQIRATTTWSASSHYVELSGDGQARTVRLAELAPADRYSVTVVAEANGGACSCTTDVVVADGPPAGGEGAGIPEPILVDEPGSSWRSRMVGQRWHVNIGHGDYRALSSDPRARLRYLVALFAKDLTVATTHPANEPLLDQMIDVLAHAERNLLRSPRS
ncbi:MAG: ATP-binding protein [Myxococcales bacterium]|nr:ATP-binding protein [Myxococcales bacterium]